MTKHFFELLAAQNFDQISGMVTEDWVSVGGVGDLQAVEEYFTHITNHKINISNVSVIVSADATLAVATCDEETWYKRDEIPVHQKATFVLAYQKGTDGWKMRRFHRSSTDVLSRSTRMGEVLALREFTLKDGVDTTALEQFFFEEVIPSRDKHVVPGLQLVNMKGDRGERDGQYIVAWIFDKVERRDHYFPEEGGAAPEFEEAYAPMQAIENKAGEYGVAPSYTDYVLVGAETVDVMPSFELLGIHKIEVTPGKEDDFEAFVTHHLNKGESAPGIHTFIYKGDRGVDVGGYIWVVAFDPWYMRDAYFPASGPSSALMEAAPGMQALTGEAISSFLSTGPGIYTDYVVVR